MPNADLLQTPGALDPIPIEPLKIEPMTVELAFLIENFKVFGNATI